MDNETNRAIEIIQEASRNGKLVIYAGAGISIDSGIPSWNALIGELKNGLGEEVKGETDILKIPQLYYNKWGEDEYYRRIGNILTSRTSKPNPLHSSIIALNPAHIITTNFDELIENKAYEEGRYYSVIRQDSDVPKAQTSQFIIKMHGDFVNHNIVLKEDDFLSYKAKFPIVHQLVQGILASNSILFIGVSFTDQNLKYILQENRDILNEKGKTAFIIFPEPISEIQKDYLRKKGIITIEISEEQKHIIKSQIENDPTKDSFEMLSEFGKSAFFSLETIRRHNPQTFSHPTDYWKNLTSYFKAVNKFNAIPYHALFNLRKITNNNFQIYYDHLIVSGEISEIFTKYFQHKTNPGEFSKTKSLPNGLHFSEIENIIKILANSGIRHIEFKNNLIEFSQTKLENITNSQSDESLIELMFQFKFDTLEKAALEASYKSRTFEALKPPFIKHLLGMNEKAQIDYEKVSREAFFDEDLIQFIAASIGNSIIKRSLTGPYEAQTIIQNIREAKRSIEKLPVNDPNVEILNELLENREMLRLFLNVHKQTEIANKRIPKNKNTFSDGWNDDHSVFEILYILSCQYINNYLPSFFSWPVNEIILLAVKSKLEWTFRSNFYNGSKNTIPAYIISLIVYFYPPNERELENMLEDYKKEKIPLAEGHMQLVVDGFLRIIQYHSRAHSSSEAKIRSYLVKVLVILQYLELSYDQFQALVMEFLKGNLWGDSDIGNRMQGLISNFILGSIHQLSEQNSDLLLDTGVFCQNDPLLLLKLFEISSPSSRVFLKAEGLLQSYILEENIPNRIFHYPLLLKYVPLKFELDIINKINTTLANKFELYNLLNLLFSKFNESFNSFLPQALDKLLKLYNDKPKNFKYYYDADTLLMDAHSLRLGYYLLLNKKLKSAFKGQINELKNLSKPFSFAVEPSKFDYVHFNVDWLYNCPNEFLMWHSKNKELKGHLKKIWRDQDPPKDLGIKLWWLYRGNDIQDDKQ